MVADILYPVRPGDTNDELRWSLRCLEANYPHGQVWISGYKPTWLINVQYVPGNHSRHTGANVYHNILRAVQNTDVADDVVIMNDDFFITRPVTDLPVGYRGTLRDHLRLPSLMRSPSTAWARSLHTTLIVLQALGFERPLSYELHQPMFVNRELMADTLDRFTHITKDAPPQWRSLYGNINEVTAELRGDVKVYGAGQIRKPFHSTDDNSWKHYRSSFAAMFPEPSSYEKPGSYNPSRPARAR